MSLPEVYFECSSEMHYNNGRDGVPFVPPALEYGVTAESFSYEPETRWEPAGGEVETPSFVSIYANGEKIGVTTWAVFLLDYASYHRMSLATAEAKISSELYERCYEHEMDRYED